MSLYKAGRVERGPHARDLKVESPANPKQPSEVDLGRRQQGGANGCNGAGNRVAVEYVEEIQNRFHCESFLDLELLGETNVHQILPGITEVASRRHPDRLRDLRQA